MTKPLTCSAACVCMALASDDILNTLERTRLEAHLAACEACRRVWEAQSRLDRAARHWAASASEDNPGADFNTRVLAQISNLPAARPALWLPLAVALVLASVLVFLPAAVRPDFGWLASSARLLPGWLAGNLSGLPADTSSLLTAGSVLAMRPIWVWGVLGAAALMNGLFCVRAARNQRRRVLS